MQSLAPLGRLALPLLLLALLVAAPPASAEQTDRLETPNASLWNGPLVAGGDLALTADGMRAAIDRRGELRRPTAAEVIVLDALAAPKLSRVYAASEVELADGTVMLAVDPELVNYTLATVGGESATHFLCVDGPTRASELVDAQPAPAVEVK